VSVSRCQRWTVLEVSILLFARCMEFRKPWLKYRRLIDGAVYNLKRGVLVDDSFRIILCCRGPDRKGLVFMAASYDRLVHEPFAHVRFTRLQRTCVACYYWIAQQCPLAAWKAGGPVKEVRAPTCSEVPGVAQRCHSMTLRQIREQLSSAHIMLDNSAPVLILSANKTFMHRELSELPLALLLGSRKAQSCISLNMLMYSAAWRS